jgi:hypothetical protein
MSSFLVRDNVTIISVNFKTKLLILFRRLFGTSHILNLTNCLKMNIHGVNTFRTHCHVLIIVAILHSAQNIGNVKIP